MKQEHSADAWRQALICMTGSAWDMEPEWEAEGALLMAYRFGNVNEDEDVIVATVEACASLWQGWSAPAFLGMAHAFMCSFPDLDTVKEQHITENYPGTHADWFKDDAPVWNGLVSDDEIMTKTDAGVFFFAKPGTDRYRALSTEAGEQA